MPDAPIEFCIDAEHPALPGHFPGHPIVPGVVVLDRVIAALAERDIRITGVRKLKFLAPLPPGQPCELQVGEPSAANLRFRLIDRRSGNLLAEGNLDLG